MTLHVALRHKTSYTYDRSIAMGPQVVRLKPAPHCRTPILSYSLTIEPANHFINWQQDPFGNFLARVVFPEPINHFSATVDLVADMAIVNPFDFFVEDSVKDWPFTYADDVKADLTAYLKPEPLTPTFKAYLKSLPEFKGPSIDFLIGLNQRISQDVNYLIRMEPGVQSPEVTLTNGSGSCRDSAWMMVQILRNYGLAARFVSGYLIQLTPDIKAIDGPVGAETDFTDLHAWSEVYIPGAGWIGLDATSGLLTGEGHIPLAATPNPSSAAPITGAHEKAEVTFGFEMDITRVLETPRVTKPYSEPTWAEIVQLGHDIDVRLQKDDVRLSMGGEPTFVAADDMEGAEWNIAAVGPTKRVYADKLVRRLHDRFGVGGLLHYGQGKWYPGEQLPRWSFELHWRTDGEPLWQDANLIASESDDSTASIDDATRFVTAFCKQLGLPEDSAFPGYEDAAHFLLIEQKLPIGETPKKNSLKDTAERERLMRVFDRGVDEVVGYVLPIQSWTAEKTNGPRRWITERWALRRDSLFLIPGDSPMGFRLPLGSASVLPDVDHPVVQPRDPFAPAPPLPSHASLLKKRPVKRLNTPAKPTDDKDLAFYVRTALTIEPRGPAVCVFMPPVGDAEDYAALLAAVEVAAKSAKVKVQIEGYTPPADPRLKVIKVTPDPGVIEVNVQPAASWNETSEITTGLYEDARHCRLSTEKFMLDGRHTGTGGGNHIVLGGLTPDDSPFLRRPDLLASIITYWQNHPSLSYLFCGMFIGPTSQAPRMDEARYEAVYEMEIALAQIPDRDDEQITPWLVDRIFRNLLIDVTGNTHRAEICIDKMYSPDGSAGRLGLVEFRAFEMPPHERMSLAQQLLIRALIAKFWRAPYKSKLVRWGTALHDRFMLPHYLWADFADVIADLQADGIKIDLEWFRPHLNFRFPELGHVATHDVKLQINQALEPWHVMGEEGSSGGMARYVDSSLERVQVKLTGQTGDRFVATCNGFALPLKETGKAGEMVAGVRYRAWAPPSALHPTIGTHVPLVFDLVDTWSGRALAGCRYHVSHPGGRNFEVFPINAYEAEGRRLARFEEHGHSSGHIDVRQPGENLDLPMTLDLRRTT